MEEEEVGEGDVSAGAVKPVTEQAWGRDCWRDARQAAVMEGVELGFMRRMEMGGGGVVEVEVEMRGSSVL